MYALKGLLYHDLGSMRVCWQDTWTLRYQRALQSSYTIERNLLKKEASGSVGISQTNCGEPWESHGDLEGTIRICFLFFCVGGVAVVMVHATGHYRRTTPSMGKHMLFVGKVATVMVHAIGRLHPVREKKERIGFALEVRFFREKVCGKIVTTAYIQDQISHTLGVD